MRDYTEIIYKQAGGRGIPLLFSQPARQKYARSPLFLVIHGGGWHGSSKEEAASFHAPEIGMLADEGIAIACVDYRLIKEEGIHVRDVISDCMDAARFLSLNAARFEIDPYRFLAHGHSAGAHLTYMVSFAPCGAFSQRGSTDAPFRVAACAGLSGHAIVHKNISGMQVWDSEKSSNPAFFTAAVGGAVFDENPIPYIEVSPYYYINPASPRFMCLSAQFDTLIPPAHGELLCARGRELGVVCTHLSVKGTGHGYDAPEAFPPDMLRREKTVEFLLSGL